MKFIEELVRSHLLFQVRNIILKLLVLLLLFEDLSGQLFHFKLDRVEFDKKLSVLLGALLNVILSPRLILDGVDLQGAD
jgi:hypothetical protein